MKGNISGHQWLGGLTMVNLILGTTFLARTNLVSSLARFTASSAMVVDR